MTFKITALKHLLVQSILFFSIYVNAQSRILIDGLYDDWVDYPLYTDTSNDGGSSGIDFGKIQVSNDHEFIFFYVEVGTNINLQDLNDVAIYLDIDNKASTGVSTSGIGADLIYTFGDRSGNYNGSIIRHADIGLITAPTITSDRFEIAIKRTFSPNGNNVSIGNSIRIIFKDNSSNGDIAPSTNGGITYTMSEEQQLPLPSYSFDKPANSDLRIISYNVERDGFFASNRESSYKRILQAVQPDIIGFQEIYDNTSKQIADRVESMLPSGSGEQWYYAGAEPDCHAISRYPILKSSKIEGSGGSGNGAFLINIPDSENDMLLVVAHPPCCTNNTGRQIEVDLIMKFIRDAKDGKGPIPIEEGSPIMIVGDMNFVGDAAQLKTLLTGDIANETSYGPDFSPDRNGSNLLDSKLPTTGLPFSYTWYSESSSFSPGKLDYILYSGSNLTLNNAYTLFTPGLSQENLNANRLQSNDVLIASDHLPVIADFTLKNKAVNSIGKLDDILIGLHITPNPSYGTTNITFNNPKNTIVSIQLINLNGKSISTIYDGRLTSGEQVIPLDAAVYPAGSYILKLVTPDAIYYKKISVIH
ncbi:endonuclease/exonuclease/phosphatase family protein [Bacteroidia bacterium]|nr:endonuclease/exonuclease/phosphatase family protein [Bacteroidia bacterium]